ncbi:MAG: ATP-binding protein [Syntrophobacterales bacterium]|nr:ATP-binding protein [Syntrophobacterales bacterium]
MKRNRQISQKSHLKNYRNLELPPSFLFVWIGVSSTLLAILGSSCFHSGISIVFIFGLLISNLLSLYGIYSSLRFLQEQQRQINEHLAQSHKLSALGEIVTGIAHEINNPLAIIYQEVQWIQHCLSSDNPDSINEIKDSIQEVSRQVQRCRDVTHKLLEFARKRKPVTQPANLNEIIEEMVKLVEFTTVTSSPEETIKIERFYDENLPLIALDVPLIKQVILNLLINAVQAMEGKGGVIKVTTRYDGKNSVEFSVIDTGCGIPPENIDKIFLPFFTTKAPGQGTGLGLSLSYTIVHSMGGTIEVESSIGKGSQFTVRLPLKTKG